jgi:hypothetical protein
MVISQAAEAMPDKIHTLVYLSALLLRDGESVVEVFQSKPNADSVLLANFEVDEAQGSSSIREEAVRDACYGHCSDEDVVLARLLLQPEAMAPLVAPIHTTAERFGSVRRVYIECLRDKALTPALQKAMYTALPCESVKSIDTDHSPFLSKPDQLADHLIAIAA